MAEFNRLQKMLEGANIKLSGTVADINGKSARNILDIVQSGEEITVAKLGEMREKKLVAANLKATDAQLADDLNGVMTSLQRKMMKVLRSHINELNRHITEFDDEIDRKPPCPMLRGTTINETGGRRFADSCKPYILVYTECIGKNRFVFGPVARTVN